MKLTVTPDPEAAALAAADVITEIVTAAPTAVLALPTGRTPVPVYRELARRRAQGTVSFSGCTVFLLDEYLGVGADDPGSFRAFGLEHIVAGLDLPEDRLRSLDGRAADPAAACDAYEDAIAEAGGLDLAVLGVGANGHIAFNEPGSEPTSRTRVVQLSAETVGTKANRTAAATEAMTIGVATITDARRVIVVAIGSAKAPAVASLVRGPITPTVPVSLLQGHHHLEVILDGAAALGLDRP